MAMLAIPAAAELVSLLGPEAAMLLSEAGGTAALGNSVNALVSGKAFGYGKKSANEVMDRLKTKAGREQVINDLSSLGVKGGKLSKKALAILNKSGLLGNRKTEKYGNYIASGVGHFQNALSKVKKVNKFF